MSGTTGTSGGSSAPAAKTDFDALRQLLAAKVGRARGRTLAQELATELSKARKNPVRAALLRALETGAAVEMSAPMRQVMLDIGVDAAALDAAAVTPAPATPTPTAPATAPAGAATGTLALAASTGTATITIPGQALAANAVGYSAEVALMLRDASSGVRAEATARVLVAREAADAFAAVAVANRFGTVFGTTGTAGVSVAVSATCAADGSSATLTLANSAAAARDVAFAVKRVAG